MNADAVLIVSFGGPEGMADVAPFLDNVLRGKPVSPARKSQVAKQYEMFNGVSPINSINRELKTLVEKKLSVPVFWGNRNWKPFIKDALVEMKQKGIRKAFAYITTAYESPSGYQTYLDNIEEARAEVENAPEISALPRFFDHPLFIQANVVRIREAISENPDLLLFTAHSIPVQDSDTYVSQLRHTCKLVAERLNMVNWNLVYQSGNSTPERPWLGPDINDYLVKIAGHIKRILVSPIGFVSDHMEVVYDLDVEAKKKADELGIEMVRAPAAGNHPLIVDMIADLVKNAS